MAADAFCCVGCSRRDRSGESGERPSGFDSALDSFIREASDLQRMTATEIKQPKYEEQLNLAESAFVKADLLWPQGPRYDKSRPLLVDALREWRLCNELRITALLDEMRATAEGQASVLAQDERLKAKSRSDLEQSFEKSRDVRMHEERASHDFAQAMEYLGRKVNNERKNIEPDS